MSKKEKVEFTSAEGEQLAFYIVEQTRINNINYILATDSDDEDMAYILKETFSDSDNEESIYEFVDNEEELEAISKVFGELLDDVDIEME